jgi:hypothetical protein
LAIIGIITGMISLAGFIYTNAIWRGKIETKVCTLWEVFMEESMRPHPEYATHNSPLTLTAKGRKLIQDDELDNFCLEIIKNYNIDKMHISDLVEKIIKEIPIERLRKMAKEKNITLSQLVSMTVLKCGKKIN